VSVEAYLHSRQALGVMRVQEMLDLRRQILLNLFFYILEGTYVDK
jgi:hypothetical protein